MVHTYSGHENKVKANLEKCGFSGEVFQGDALRFLESRETYGLIFLDPPYRSGLYGYTYLE